ncbi:hypothetical protein QJS66_19420 [Kocuria rhizophila]|nr:hypothetical protein QJS66_19420 [Kocuria rhizophila]
MLSGRDPGPGSCGSETPRPALGTRLRPGGVQQVISNQLGRLRGCGLVTSTAEAQHLLLAIPSRLGAALGAAGAGGHRGPDLLLPEGCTCT